MAYTKIHSIKSTLDRAIAYIISPEKTDGTILVSTFGCSKKTAAYEFEMTRRSKEYTGINLAYHCIQSFKPYEVSPEQAHAIGIQTADELLKGKYEYVVATHIDRGHIHNHIIINGCSFESGLAFSTEYDKGKSNPAWKRLRKISDEICIENKLSVIAMPEKGYGRCYYEWLQDQRDNSYKSKLKNTIDKCILISDSFDDFLKRMSDEKYEYKIRGDSLLFRADGQERFTRCSHKRLGWYYSPEQLKKRIERQVKKRSATVTKENGFFEVHEENAVGLNRWAMLKNMQEASRVLNILADYGIGSVEELEEKISNNYDRRFDLVQKLNDYEKSIQEQRELLKMLQSYWQTKTIHDEYIKNGLEAKFKQEHKRELAIFDSSKAWLRERYTGKTLPNRTVVEMKIAEDESKRESLLSQYHEIKKEISQLEKEKSQIDKYLDISQDKKKSIELE